uniref:Gelsolin-like domain-containing protein n=1 Tax=Helicotheca tamesis TaxID=374047 RepID=A0A6U0HJX9_9STRA|mmetsp:Transcript_7839/g.10733  ORF Transcript_7839/g.10733 Transcript_7839/m.10733 type:complete len:383 (+) Transcript_7839:133-1281(+)|eukprot:CAMPEP_0185729352 /NCGR_PEP_ID=MMETSP1171-20130828/5245_1 /TAXON_ID=374046 /ORGANISM="Helicotheca tamensis, Strain CCMP826" /LENGTH=382 /DNA_ID=CAMNT_0028398165 /DNA_START=109 /DNA_END=1257 /DNA_ORIENTATION=+
MADTPIEESNLAHIGSDEDKAAKKAAAESDPMWKDAGTKVGIQIWRVENKRTENDNADFGINHWPKKQYGKFHRGDSYIVLETREDDDEDGDGEDGGFLWDIYFWIGAESSQDEYGVAAYKANELDDLLNGTPTQHRECEGYETEEFLDLFPHIQYLEGGVDSGFRDVDADEGGVEFPTRLFHIRRREDTKKIRCFQCKIECASLNQGDAFILDNNETIYTWFGTESSPFEKHEANRAAHVMADGRFGHSKIVTDVEDDCEEFWELLGGREEIKAASEFHDDKVPDETETKLYKLSEENGKLDITQLEPVKSNLDTDAACMVDIGRYVFVWLGKGSNERERKQAMIMTQDFVNRWERTKTTTVIRVMEGKERKVRAWKKAFK